MLDAPVLWSGRRKVSAYIDLLVMKIFATVCADFWTDRSFSGYPFGFQMAWTEELVCCRISPGCSNFQHLVVAVPRGPVGFDFPTFGFYLASRSYAANLHFGTL